VQHEYFLKLETKHQNVIDMHAVFFIHSDCFSDINFDW